jgi:hypothetical protein
MGDSYPQMKMTYLPNIPRRVAHLLAMLQVRDYPDDKHEQFVFLSTELDINDDEVVIVTYERRQKPHTLPVFQAVSVTTPELEYV